MSGFQEDVEAFILDYWNAHEELPIALKVKYLAPSRNERKVIVEMDRGKTEELIFNVSGSFTIIDISNRIDARARA